MKRLYLFILLLLLMVLGGCSSYNTPYINTEETLQIREGLTFDQTKQMVGTPLMVIAGEAESAEVLWIYEVRGRAVKSQTNGQPNKTNEDQAVSHPLHRLQVVFLDGKVNRWGPFNGLPLNHVILETSDGPDSTTTIAGVADKPNKVPRVRIIPVVSKDLGDRDIAALGARVEVGLFSRIGIGGQFGAVQYKYDPISHYWDDYYYSYQPNDHSKAWYGGYVFADLLSSSVIHILPVAGFTYWIDEVSPFAEVRFRFMPESKVCIDIAGGRVFGEYGDNTYISLGVGFGF